MEYDSPSAARCHHADVFNAVAEARRREILAFLAADERPVGDIVAAMNLAQPSVSKHLKVLRDVGLVTVRRDGRQIFYRTNLEAIRPLHEWTSTFERFWRHQLTRVKERAEASAQGREAETMTDRRSSKLSLNITRRFTCERPLEATFDALLEQMGPANETPTECRCR